MPDQLITSTPLPPRGEVVLTPPLEDLDRSGCRIELIGLFRIRIGDTGPGEVFDAMRRSGADGSFSETHSWLRWSPRPPVLESADQATHRYVFRVPATGWPAGSSLGVALDTAQLVDEFLVSPSEVQAGLSGQMLVRAYRTPAPLSLWSAGAVAFPAAALAIGGIGWAVQRRRRYGALGPELAERLQRIERGCRSARASALQARRVVPFQQPVEEQVLALQAGSADLIRQIHHLRSARGFTSTRTLDRELAHLRERVHTETDPLARREVARAADEKEKARTVVEDLLRTEAQATARLDKIEALLEGTTLALRSAGVRAVAPDEELCRALGAEVDAVHEVSGLLRSGG